MQHIPAKLASEPFTKAVAVAEEAALSPEDRWVYEESLKQARIINAQLSAAEEKGMTRGIEKGRLTEKFEIARSMRRRGMDVELILEVTGLTKAEFNQLPSNADNAYR